MTTLRQATLADVPALERLIAESARELCRHDYTGAQIEAAIGTAWGVDRELIRDGTYFVAEAAGEIVACGGWSKRRTLFGGDAQPGRQSEVLDPARDAARIRAFFVHPAWARRGIGVALLERCEAEARARGSARPSWSRRCPGSASTGRSATPARNGWSIRWPAASPSHSCRCERIFSLPVAEPEC